MDVAYRLNGKIALVTNGEILFVGKKEDAENHPDPRVQQFIHGRLIGPLTPNHD
jgi:ABC-type transporter Mla maintaining outer membrane lipid asymmetry ATPase subunit MlaF